ncbi:MAG: C13 family peptidase [Caulobacteraceae bacterium]
MRAWLALAAVLAGPLAARGAPTPAPFSDWAAVVVAGDDHAAHTESMTETFDNARRDVTGALARGGFAPAHIAQFSTRPERYRAAHPGNADLAPIAARLTSLARAATGGCLVYITSHGAPEGVVMDGRLVSPRALADAVGAACGARPTAVIVSACFSGVFVPALAGPNRMVFTAARSDRSSFGCGESDKYPFFDACVLASFPFARDLIDLAPRVRRCVARHEDDVGARPRSQPQLFVGAAFRATSPAFAAPRLAAFPAKP